MIKHAHTQNLRQGEICVGSARIPAHVIELAQEGAVLRPSVALKDLDAQAVRIFGVGYLPVSALRAMDDGLVMMAFDRPSAKVRRKLATALADSNLDLAGPALAYLAKH